MRLIALLIALLLVGLLVYQQLGSHARGKAESIPAVRNSNAPKVPDTINGTRQFGAKMNDYVKKQAAQREKAIDKATGQ